MKKVLTIAKWEFIEKVKRKSFIIYMIVFPMILILLGVIPTLIGTAEVFSPKPIGIVDTSEIYFGSFSKKLESIFLPDGQPQYLILKLSPNGNSWDNFKIETDKKVFDNLIEGYIIIKHSNDKEIGIEYLSKYSGNFRDARIFEDLFNEVLTEIRLKEAGLEPKLASEFIGNAEIKSIKLNKEGGEEESSFLKTFFSAYVFIMLLLMMIVFSGGMLVRNVVEEKSNRIMEILLSSCTADDLLTGKIIGLSWLGLFQLTVWSLVGTALIGSSLVSLNLITNIGWQLLFFLLGYILYTSIFVGIGSVVSSEQEAQQITGYISILLVIPIMISTQVIQNPDSTLALILTYFPLTTAPIMLLRLNIYTPPIIEILLAVIVSIISIYLVIYISSKIFRIGILSYGKRPTLKELREWLREK